MATVFDYIFNVGGNFKATVSGMTETTGEFTAAVEGTQSKVGQLVQKLATLDLATGYVERLSNTMSGLSQSGIALDSQMHDLSAVAGVTGEGLKQIEGFARESAKAFGTDASVAVEGYKLLLSQLTPELGKYPEALREMGDCIQTTSKLMGGDGAAAAQVLTTAMNQYGVSMEDPIAASKTMADMMNTMAAAGQAGSAELPAIAAALNQCGMAAKAAGVSFEETNAAIQVLDKAGKKASEGGVALRNVLGQLSKGRFIEKQAAEELAAAGIDVTALADKSKSLHDRLELLKPLLKDDALLSKFFGVENANAARALIQGTDALGGFTEAVTGTSSATDQAAVVMDSFAEKQARHNAQIEDFKISLFQATGGLTLWAGSFAEVLVPLGQMWPILQEVWGGFAALWALRPKNLFKDIRDGANRALISMRNLTIGTYMTAVSFGGFKVMAVNACRAISTAIKSIPIVGWIAAAIAIVIEVVQILWDKCKGFRVAVFTALELFKRLGELIVMALQEAWNWLKDLWSKTSEWVAGVVEWVTQAYTQVVDFFVGIWAKITGAINWVINLVQTFAAWIVEKAMNIYNAVVGFITMIWDTIMGIISSISEKIAAFVDMVASVFSSVYNTVVGWVAQIWAKVSSIIDKIRNKLAGFLRPIVNACKQAYNQIRSWFNSLFSWIETKINSVIDWFVDIYNKIAAALGWDEIKARGKARAEGSWAKDHPAATGPGAAGAEGLASAETGEVPTVASAAAGTNVTGGGLSTAGTGGSGKGNGSDGAGKIRNINITIDRLVENLHIHAATVTEGTEQMKAAVLEALMGALNDTQLAMD